MRSMALRSGDEGEKHGWCWGGIGCIKGRKELNWLWSILCVGVRLDMTRRQEGVTIVLYRGEVGWRRRATWSRYWHIYVLAFTERWHSISMSFETLV